jgi:hypothetical protein
VHTQFFASKLLNANIPFRWISTDPDPTSLASIAAYLDEDQNDQQRKCVDEPFQLTLNSDGIMEEAAQAKLQPSSIDTMIAINLIHISPPAATLGLMKAAGSLLKDGGKLYLCGPYRVGGVCVDSNL